MGRGPLNSSELPIHWHITSPPSLWDSKLSHITKLCVSHLYLLFACYSIFINGLYGNYFVMQLWGGWNISMWDNDAAILFLSLFLSSVPSLIWSFYSLLNTTTFQDIQLKSQNIYGGERALVDIQHNIVGSTECCIWIIGWINYSCQYENFVCFLFNYYFKTL